MSGPEFFQTRMGQKFYEATAPAIARALEGIHEELTRQNDLKERELDRTPDPMFYSKSDEEPEEESETETEQDPVVEPEPDTRTELEVVRDYLANHTMTLPPCPSCKHENAIKDAGRHYLCQFCNHYVGKE